MNYYGIAHVTLVFFTRTLSNSFESFLVLTLIYFIHINISLILSATVNSSKKIKFDSKSAKNTVRSSSQAILITIHMIWSSIMIGFICALGIFNRPTFPAFAVVPIVYWFINIMRIINRAFHLQVLLSKIISCIIGTFIITSSLLILFDSYYYNNGFSFIIDLQHRLIVCPLNFIFYNIDTKNLDEHGLHPSWLHFIVNATILFGPLHLCVILWSLSRIGNVKQFGKTIINHIVNLAHKNSMALPQSGIM